MEVMLKITGNSESIGKFIDAVHMLSQSTAFDDVETEEYMRTEE